MILLTHITLVPAKWTLCLRKHCKHYALAQCHIKSKQKELLRRGDGNRVVDRDLPWDNPKNVDVSLNDEIKPIPFEL